MHHEIDRAAQQLPKGFGKAEERRCSVSIEFDQKVHIAAHHIKIDAVRGGPEDFEPPDVEPTTEFGQGVAFAADHDVHIQVSW